MKRFFRQGLLLAIVISTTFTAAAQVTLTVDTSAKEFFFGGSASGIPGSDSVGAVVTWRTDGSAANLDSIQVQSAFAQLELIPLARFEVHDSGRIAVALDLRESSNLTITPDSQIRFDYSGFQANRQAIFEQFALDGLAINLDRGTGFGSVRTTAVPEVQLFGLVIFGSLMLFAIRRRRFAS